MFIYTVGMESSFSFQFLFKFCGNEIPRCKDPAPFKLRYRVNIQPIQVKEFYIEKKKNIFANSGDIFALPVDIVTSLFRSRVRSCRDKNSTCTNSWPNVKQIDFSLSTPKKGVVVALQSSERRKRAFPIRFHSWLLKSNGYIRLHTWTLVKITLFSGKHKHTTKLHVENPRTFTVNWKGVFPFFWGGGIQKNFSLKENVLVIMNGVRVILSQCLKNKN
jgi:hypothetical protein